MPILAIPLPNAIPVCSPFSRKRAGAVGGVDFLGHLDIWPIRGPVLADDPAGKQAYAEPIDAQVSR
ncbi:hypothetical protein, partial [Mesorhizobium sp. M7A.F.Ca.CA.001.06.1.1]|uniref:hypothetical protein n=1 Tax=Mesorhizobium sp. M7A.F.Ca.CA.001.06.1.1 TaxID=2496682 RepID=UPI0019D1CCBF